MPQIKGKALFDNCLINYICDSGASRTVISKKLFNKIKKETPSLQLRNYRGKPLKSCTGSIRVLGTIKINKCILSAKHTLNNVIITVAHLNTEDECLLGRDVLRKIPIVKTEMEQMRATIHEMSLEVTQLIEKNTNKKCFELNLVANSQSSQCLTDGENKSQRDESSNESNSTTSNENTCVANAPSKDTSIPTISTNNESEEIQLDTVRNEILNELRKVSATSMKELTPHKNTAFAFKITLLDPSHPPITCKCRRLPWYMKSKVKQALDDQLEAGIIRQSHSAWCSPLRAVEKPDGSARITGDYKELNKIIEHDNYPIPSIADLYNKLAEADTFSKIDLKAAYHQIPIEENSIEYTAFICEFGVFEYLSMPMGIKTAPAWFQRFMEQTFQDLIVQNTLGVYLDDSVLFTNGLTKHREVALQLIQTIADNNLKASFEKSIVAVQKVEILGNTISHGQIKPNKKRAQCFETIPKPKTIREMQVWLGIANHYRQRIFRATQASVTKRFDL